MTEVPIDRDAIKAEYLAELPAQQDNAKARSRYLFRGIRLFLVLPCLTLTLTIVLMLLTNSIVHDDPGYYDERTLNAEYRSFGWGLGLSFLYFSLAWFIYLLAWEKIHVFERMKTQGFIFPIAEDQGTHLNKMVKELASKMGIDFSMIVFWGTLSNNKYPSIEEDKAGFIHLLVPLHFLSLLEETEEESRAVLAHELGHVLQEDTKLYLFTDAYFTVIRDLLLPAVVVNFVVSIGLLFVKGVASSLSSPQFVVPYIIEVCLNLFIIYYLQKGFEELRTTRRTSELLADTASVIYADGSALKAVLECLPDLGVENRAAATHPGKYERIEHIDGLLHLDQ
jgi:hypothetical protein